VTGDSSKIELAAGGALVGEAGVTNAAAEVGQFDAKVSAVQLGDEQQQLVARLEQVDQLQAKQQQQQQHQQQQQLARSSSDLSFSEAELGLPAAVLQSGAQQRQQQQRMPFSDRLAGRLSSPRAGLEAEQQQQQQQQPSLQKGSVPYSGRLAGRLSSPTAVVKDEQQQQQIGRSSSDMSLSEEELGLPAAVLRSGAQQQQQQQRMPFSGRLAGRLSSPTVGVAAQQQQQQLARSNSDMSLSEDLGLPAAALQSSAKCQEQPQQQQQ
jgi:hypothetical protein